MFGISLWRYAIPFTQDVFTTNLLSAKLGNMGRDLPVSFPKLIFAKGLFLCLEVEAIIPDDDPCEPCLEPETARWLDELQQLADQGKVDELAKYGDVYVRRSA